MMKYERPTITIVKDASEGIYLSSGSTQDDTADNGIKCQSIYLKGVWHKPNHSLAIASRAKNIDVKGCEGCSADDGDGCKILKKGELNAYGVFMPTWEQEGQKPDDLTW